MTHRENRTTHRHKLSSSYKQRPFGPPSHRCRYRFWSGMQSCGNRRTKLESECLGGQNTPPQNSEAGSLIKCTVVLA